MVTIVYEIFGQDPSNPVYTQWVHESMTQPPGDKLKTLGSVLV